MAKFDGTKIGGLVHIAWFKKGRGIRYYDARIVEFSDRSASVAVNYESVAEKKFEVIILTFDRAGRCLGSTNDSLLNPAGVILELDHDVVASARRFEALENDISDCVYNLAREVEKLSFVQNEEEILREAATAVIQHAEKILSILAQ